MGMSPVNVKALLAHSLSYPVGPPPIVLSHPVRDAASAARMCRRVLDDGGSLVDGWRFGVLQTIDFYSAYAMAGARWAAQEVFRQEPQTGVACLDAAFAALAEYCADRDGWTAPGWATDPTRVARPAWYVALSAQVPGYLRDECDRVTPDAFRRHGVFIGLRDLERA